MKYCTKIFINCKWFCFCETLQEKFMMLAKIQGSQFNKLLTDEVKKIAYKEGYSTMVEQIWENWERLYCIYHIGQKAKWKLFQIEYFTNSVFDLMF